MKARAIPLLAAMLATVTLPAPPLSAQELDAEGWVGLVQMPVTVARLDLAGVPSQSLGLLIPALNTPDVPPSLFVQTVWGIPVLWGDDANDYGGPVADAGSYVQAMHTSGLRGRDLAAAIHEELDRRGVPRGAAASGKRPDALHPGYLPDDWVDERFRDDPLFPDGSAVLARSGRGHGGGLFGPAGGVPAEAVDSPPAVRTDGAGGSS